MQPDAATSESSREGKYSLAMARLSRLLGIAAAGLTVIGAAFAFAVFYLSVFRPAPYIASSAANRDYDPSPMQRAVAPVRVRSRLDSIVGFGSRLLGQPGMYRTEELIRGEFERAGLDVYEHTHYPAAPHSRYRELYDCTDSGGPGRRIDDVDIFPFMPNHIQPVVTGDSGIVGELVLLDPHTLRTRKRFDNCIGLIDSREGRYDPEFAFAWVRYAKLGIKGLIVSHSAGLDHAPWNIIAYRFSGMVTDLPVNYPRVAATRSVFDYIGKTVRLRVRVDFAPTRCTDLYGVLRAPGGAREAIVVYAGYDASSILPDRAPAPMQAVEPALQLQVLEGLTAYRTSLQRDVIFFASGATMMAEDGLNNLLRILGENEKTAESNRLLSALGVKQKRQTGRRMQRARGHVEDNEDSLALVEELRALFNDPMFLVDPATTAAALDALPARLGSIFEEQYSYVMKTIVFHLSEPKLQAKIAFERDTSRGPQGPLFERYLAAKRTFDRAASAAGFSVLNLLRKKSSFAAELDVRGRCRERFDELVAFHRRTSKRLQQELRLVELFDSYDNIAAFELSPVPALAPAESDEVLTLSTARRNNEPAVPTVFNVLSNSRQRLGLGRELDLVMPTDEQLVSLGRYTDLWPFISTAMWVKLGYPAYAFINLERTESYRHMGDPVDRPAMRDMQSLQSTNALVGESIVSLAHGNGELRPVIVEEHVIRDWGGQVLASNVGQSIVPNYPLKDAIVAARPFAEKAMFSMPGSHIHPYVFTDPYGRYYLEKCASDWPEWWRVYAKGGYNPIAAAYGADGFITYIKDAGEDGQRLFKSTNLPFTATVTRNVTIVTFRAAPVTVLDLTNPQSMKDYTGLEAIDASGLTPFAKRCAFADKGVRAVYLPPEERFYATLQSGASDNELVKVTRAFLLGIDDPWTYRSEKEVDGPGYLVADSYFLLNVARETARSMTWLNQKRLDLQNRHAMADEQTRSYHRKTTERLEWSRESAATQVEADRMARDAVVYAMLSHPVLRDSVFEAVMGILWYLGLLVPFVFFFEKLLFCNTDIRKQLAAQAIIFLVVFSLLRVLHPAFQMVRSSLMILLGFVIMLISGGITLLFSGKFQENLEELRRKQGKVAAAEVNKAGVIASAFMLGLNNMHRRKVRTGLTCATLSLLTFVMICFTSVQNSIVEENVPVGKAPYQGMMIEREGLLPISDAEVFAMRGKYDDRYEVSCRRVLIGREDWRSRKRKNPQIVATYRSGGVLRRYELHSAIQLNHCEPLRDRFELLAGSRWFTESEDRDGESMCPVIIPDMMADLLGITMDRIKRSPPVIDINGTRFKVIAVFDSRSLNKLRDLDGRDLLPFDVESMGDPVMIDGYISAGDEDPRIDPSRLVITPMRSVFNNVSSSRPRIVSVSVNMGGAGYSSARSDIDSYLEQTGKRVYYGLDGVAYRGRRTRATTMGGLIDLLIPLLIAGLTVLNTMKGSVYERQGEIFVYNAVGIAPRYVFFMFIAEAFVYAVVGSVLGYLLSQGTGRVLTMLDFTGGLNMTYTSLATIYASLTIAGAVFLSTYYPARSAMEIAAPAEESGWSLPEPDGDELVFDLPFNFSTHGRVAVLVFFDRYLRDNGEGSAGRFFAGVPRIGVRESLDEESGGYVPLIRTTIWLKPFDLAVCQRMTISMPSDPDTGQFKASVLLERLSGTREAWMRLNGGFVTLIRRHFLHWRAVSDEEREEMFLEARESMRRGLLDEFALPAVAGNGDTRSGRARRSRVAGE